MSNKHNIPSEQTLIRRMSDEKLEEEMDKYDQWVQAWLTRKSKAGPEEVEGWINTFDALNEEAKRRYEQGSETR